MLAGTLRHVSNLLFLRVKRQRKVAVDLTEEPLKNLPDIFPTWIGRFLSKLSRSVTQELPKRHFYEAWMRNILKINAGPKKGLKVWQGGALPLSYTRILSGGNNGRQDLRCKVFVLGQIAVDLWLRPPGWLRQGSF
jgi:hypothetical protein